MRFYQISLSLILALAAFSCTAKQSPQTPRETMIGYTQAIKNKDVGAIKELLSADSLAMAQNEAKEQKTSLDDVIQKESFFNENQKVVEFRNEKITGDKASIEVRDSSKIWNTVQFVRENGVWKIDRKAYADDLQKQIDEDDKRLQERINQSREQ